MCMHAFGFTFSYATVGSSVSLLSCVNHDTCEGESLSCLFQRGLPFIAGGAFVNAHQRPVDLCSNAGLSRCYLVQPHPIHQSSFRNNFNYNYLSGSRVGEASNPGPDGTISVCLINPTSIASKKDLLLSLEADVIAMAETSATSFIQHEFATSLRGSPFSIWWGLPVDDKFKHISFGHDRPSRRGEALGTAILTKLPSRRSRIEDSGVLHQSGRFNVCVCNFGAMEVLVISVYFFPGRTTEAQTLNDLMLSHVYDYIARSDIPFLIAGDFNQKIQTLTAWKAFAHRDCAEGFDLASSVLGKDLPPTCRNATRFDSFIFHPLLAAMVRDMWVGPSHIFADHLPTYAKFSVSSTQHMSPTLYVPQDWSIFDLDPEILQQQYRQQSQRFFLPQHIQSSANSEHKLCMWSEVIENSICKTLQWMHRQDPLRNPQPKLPAHFRGRCQPPRYVRPTTPRSVKHDWTGGFNPSGEPTSLKTCLKVRQTRRLASLLRQVKKHVSIHIEWLGIPPVTRQALHREWECIRRAHGFGSSWEHWILQFECVPLLPQSVPDLPLLHLFLQLTKHETDLSVRQEEKTRRAAKKHLIRQDQKDKNGSLVFQALRETEQKVISGLPCPVQSEAKLIRLSKGRFDSF